MVLVPTSSGMEGADHADVPVAIPDPNPLACQVTLATPTLSVAVPDTAIVAAVVCIVNDAGDVSVSTGGTVS